MSLAKWVEYRRIPTHLGGISKNDKRSILFASCCRCAPTDIPTFSTFEIMSNSFLGETRFKMGKLIRGIRGEKPLTSGVVSPQLVACKGDAMSP